MEMATKWRRWATGDSVFDGGECEERVELRRKSWVTAMPMEAKEREVRSQARKVRSTGCCQYMNRSIDPPRQHHGLRWKRWAGVAIPSAR
jgi:hypothetical protein